ncbi:MAG: CBS domain-containing protein [Leptospiraceae bacterium]|nr:CBS domain-containing protein [Leptospiraceae bacterium]
MPFIWIDSGVSSRYKPEPGKDRVHKVHKFNESTTNRDDVVKEHPEDKGQKDSFERRDTSSISRPKLNPYEDMEFKAEEAESVQAILARHVMSSPVIEVEPSLTVEKAVYLFRKNRIRHIPVINYEKKLIGIISERGILQNFLDYPEDISYVKNRLIEEVMISRVLTAKPESPLPDMARVMLEERIGSLPILNEERKVLGIVTRSDILKTILYKDHIDYKA